MQTQNAVLNNPTFIICQLLQTVGMNLGFRILDHYPTSLIINIDQRRGRFRQFIKKALFRLNVFRKGPVVIQMIMAHIGEHCHLEMQTGNPTLIHRMRTYFHKSIFTSLVDHLPQ